jgi:hypothetical protein
MIIDSTEQLIENKRLEFEKYKEFVESHSKIHHECKKLRYRWSSLKEDRNGSLTIDNNYCGVNLNLSLAEDDSIDKDVNLYMEDTEEFLSKFGYSLDKVDEHVPGKWIHYWFSHKSDETYIHIFMNYDIAESCKVVGTGEFEEIKKRVCV